MRVQLDEVKELLDKTDDAEERKRLEKKENSLKQTLKDLRDLRTVTANYYTAPRDENLTSAGIHVGHRDRPKQ